MCERGDTLSIVVLIPNGHGHLVEVFKEVDRCLANIIKALNKAEVQTVASCCGHGIQPGVISLADGREIFIAPDYKTARKINAAFPPLSRMSKEELPRGWFYDDKGILNRHPDSEPSDLVRTIDSE